MQGRAASLDDEEVAVALSPSLWRAILDLPVGQLVDMGSCPNAAVFVRAMAEWLSAHGARAYTSWNSDQAFLGRLDDRTTAWPGPVGAFNQAFGAP